MSGGAIKPPRIKRGETLGDSMMAVPRELGELDRSAPTSERARRVARPTGRRRVTAAAGSR